VSDIKKTNQLIFLDIETTGLNPYVDRIIEIGAHVYEKGKSIKNFSTLINPGQAISEHITRITGIGTSMLKNAPRFEDISDELFSLLQDNIFIAHNVGFDYSFMQSEFKRLGIAYTSRRLCTVKLSRYLFPEHKRHNLDSIITRHAIICTNRHRASDDAEAIMKFYDLVSRSTAPEKFVEAISNSRTQ